MIWKHWPISQLQNEIGNSVLETIGKILPLLDKDGETIFFETDRKSLVKLMASFADENYFGQEYNIVRCLNYLPPELLKSMINDLHDESLEKEGVDISIIGKVISKNHSVKREFLKFFDLPQRFYPKISESKPHIFVSYPPSAEYPIEITSSYKVLKDYQYDIFYRSVSRLSPPMARMILQMPTGAGKTRTVMEIIAGHFNSGNSKKIRVVWLANSEELCEQAVACFTDVWKHVAQYEVEVQRVWGGMPKPQELQYSTCRQFIVASLQSLWKLVSSNDEKFNDVFSQTTLLVIDEAHISVAETYSKVVQKISNLSHCRIVGLTATPGRTIEEETTELSDLFHGEIVSLRDPSNQWENAIAYLRSINVLSQVKYDPLVVDSDISLSANDFKKLNDELDFSTSLLKKIGASTVRNAEIAARLKPLLNDGAKVLLFAPSIESSKFLTSLFTFLGFSAAHIDGKTHSTTRARIIEDYVEGEMQVLCNYGVLATGFDAPKTDVLCIARPTKSPVLYSQMIGRGLRGPAVGGSAKCRIIEVKDNFIGQGTQDELYDHFSEYWKP
jgi:DNA repair protein RadD